MTVHPRPKAALAPFRKALVEGIEDGVAALPDDVQAAPTGSLDAQEAVEMSTLLSQIDATLDLLDQAMADVLDAAIDETVEAAN
jgi:hypothetical protein